MSFDLRSPVEDNKNVASDDVVLVVVVVRVAVVVVSVEEDGTGASPVRSIERRRRLWTRRTRRLRMRKSRNPDTAPARIMTVTMMPTTMPVCGLPDESRGKCEVKRRGKGT
jgi:hypothetical protein